MKRRSKRVVTIICAVGLAVGSLAGCRGIRGQSTNQDVANQEEKATVIRVGAMPFYLSVPLQVIEDENLDDQFGFKLEIIDFPSGGPMAEALGAGEWDIGPIGAGGMVAIPNYNAKLIMDVENAMDGSWIMARPDSDIVKAGNTLSDYPEVIGSADSLKGKTVLGTVGNISHYMGLDYLNKFGLGMDDVNFVHMETAQIYTAFVAGNGDLACIGDPAACYKLEQEGYVCVGGLKQLGKPQQDSMLVSNDFYKNHYADCVKFVEAWLTAADKLNADPDFEKAMTAKFYKDRGRSDITDDFVAKECEWNAYVDSSNALDRETGVWMKGLIQFMVDNGSMEPAVIEKMKSNIKLDVLHDALSALKEK